MKMTPPISPWEQDDIEVSTPSGRLSVLVQGASEIAMGAPTCGVLRLASGRKISSCNPSLVFSQDEQFLAVPRWTRARDQKLAILRLDNGAFLELDQKFRVLKLLSFSAARVRGIDSPVYQPVEINIDVSDVLKRLGGLSGCRYRRISI